MKHIHNILSYYGLTDNEVALYELLLKNKELDITQLVNKSGFSRSGVYNALDTLFLHELIEFRKDGRRAYYSVAHPNQLAVLKQKKEQERMMRGKEMEMLIDQLGSQYEMLQEKPGVRYFQGKDGLTEALHLSLQSSDTIYAYVDVRKVQKYVPDINAQYMAERIEKEIHKKLILVDSPEARELMPQPNSHPFTERKFISEQDCMFSIGFEIYNNEILYLTANDDEYSAFLVSHPEIAEYHKGIFNYIWKTLD